MRVANLRDGGDLLGGGFGQAFDLDEKNGGAVHRKAGVDVVFDGAEGPTVKHFARGRGDGARGDVHNGVRGVIHGVEDRQQRFDGFGFARKLDGDFGDQGERAFGADEEAGEIVTESVTVFAADPHDFAIGKHKLERGDVIGGDAVGERVRAASVFGNVAADSAGFPTRGIGREIQAVRLGGAREFVVDDAGLDNRALIFRVELENAIHAREDNHHAAGAGERASGKAGAGAAADDGNIVFGSQLDDLRNLFRGFRENNNIGATFFDGAIEFIKKCVLRLIKN